MENNQENSSISKNEDKKEDPEKYDVTDNGIFSLKKPRDVRNQPFLFVSFLFSFTVPMTILVPMNVNCVPHAQEISAARLNLVPMASEFAPRAK